MKTRLVRLFPLLCVPFLLTSCADAANPPAAKSPSSTTASKEPTGPTTCPAPDGSAPRRTTFTQEPPMCIDPAKGYTATVTTDLGEFTVELDAAKAPKTVNNFVVLSRYHFYDGLSFHRVMPGFVVQGGDPQGTGAGGPGYRFADELPTENVYSSGAVAMANAGPNTNGSQFFVATGNQAANLPPAYSYFGKVTVGMDVVKKIEADGSPTGAPSKKHTMQKVVITEK